MTHTQKKLLGLTPVTRNTPTQKKLDAGLLTIGPSATDTTITTKQYIARCVDRQAAAVRKHTNPKAPIWREFINGKRAITTSTWQEDELLQNFLKSLHMIKLEKIRYYPTTESEESETVLYTYSPAENAVKIAWTTEPEKRNTTTARRFLASIVPR